jgi:two-component system, cell cycle sensor histidine kinase and response regulator CckA
LPRDVGSTTRETVGRLAGGIADDFNNLLTVINGSADLALDLHDPPAAVREDLRQIREAGERAATLTRQLLAFSRKQILPSDVVDVNRMIAGIEAMLKRLIGEHLQLVVALDEEAGNVRSDAGQLEQVLLNLVVNARDAMPDGGTLAIRTQRLRLEPGDTRPPALAQAGLQPGTHLVIAVSDTGVGMDEATRLRVFEPFYTTKEPERGTGLGLAMVHGIVMQTGGAIWVDSEPGAGATFSVSLPSTA